MIRIRDISMPADHRQELVQREAARLLKIGEKQILKFRVVRKSIDARKKPDVRVIYTVDVAVAGKEEKILRASGCKKAGIAKEETYQVPKVHREDRPVVVGFGPAGMFAALVLAMAGCRPIVLERGDMAQVRKEKVDAFFAAKNIACNVF